MNNEDRSRVDSKPLTEDRIELNASRVRPNKNKYMQAAINLRTLRKVCFEIKVYVIMVQIMLHKDCRNGPLLERTYPIGREKNLQNKWVVTFLVHLFYLICNFQKSIVYLMILTWTDKGCCLCKTLDTSPLRLLAQLDMSFRSIDAPQSFILKACIIDFILIVGSGEIHLMVSNWSMSGTLRLRSGLRKVLKKPWPFWPCLLFINLSLEDV